MRKIKIFAGDCRMRNEELMEKRSDISASEPPDISKKHKLQQTSQYLEDLNLRHPPEKKARNAIEATSGVEFESLGDYSYAFADMRFLSAFMNAFVISLPLAKIQQQNIRCSNENKKIHCNFLKIPEIICVGSMAEGLSIDSDYDMIVFANYSPFLHGCTILPIPEKEYPGYSQLLVSQKIDGQIISSFYLENTIKESIIFSAAKDHCPNGLSIHGPAYNAILYESGEEALFRHGETTDNRLDVDFVLCIKRTEWPTEAIEWTSRKRASNVPTQELVRIISKAGYFLAAVGSKESNDSGIQWRVSFNKAEQLMIESFNETQMHCIFLLKLLKNNCLSQIAEKNITSYTMKTVMFWCLEEESDIFWQSSNLVCCFCFCVSKLKSFVEKAFLPNYFIRKRNLFVTREFTFDIKTKTCQYLESFLEDPKARISLLLTKYREKANNTKCTWKICSLTRVIIRWLQTQTSMATALADPFKFILTLYDEYNIQHISQRCDDALDKLTAVGFTQPLIKILQNYIGVLQYLILMENNETGEQKTDSDARQKYSKYMTLSSSGDLTHNTLRMATCYLDDDEKEDCLDKIQSVTEFDGQFFMQTHRQRLKNTIQCDIDMIDALSQKEHDYYKISLYNSIINDVDNIYQNPYVTTAVFDYLKSNGKKLIGYDSLILAWKKSYFDVTFFLVELPVLPKPAALELCIDFSQKHISFHPFLYGLLLEFLWHEKYGSGNEEKESVLAKMKNCNSDLPHDQQYRGLNFIVYCYLLQKDYRSASRYLFRSFKLNPVKQNVAYLYIKYTVALLREVIQMLMRTPVNGFTYLGSNGTLTYKLSYQLQEK